MTENEFKATYVLVFMAGRAAAMLDCAAARGDVASLTDGAIVAVARELADAAWKSVSVPSADGVPTLEE